MASHRTRWAWLAGAVLLAATLASCQNRTTQGIAAQEPAPSTQSAKADAPAASPRGGQAGQTPAQPVTVSSQYPTSQPASTWNWGQGDSAMTSHMLWQMLAYVLVILVLGGLAIFMIRRVMPRLGISTGKSITVLETAYLGPRKTLHLVKVGRRAYIIAASHERLGEPVDVTDALDGAGAKTFAQAVEAAQARQSRGKGGES